MIKRIMITAFAGLLLLPLTAQAFEYGGLQYEVRDAVARTAALTGPVDKGIKTLDVPAMVPYDSGTGKQHYKVTEIGVQAFQECSALESVSLPEGVVRIGYCAFFGCGMLNGIKLPSTVVVLESGAFDKCDILRTVELNEGLEEIGREAFRYAISLREIVIPESVKKIDDYAFDGCTALRKVIFNGVVESIGGFAFSGDTSLKEVHGKDVETWCRMGFVNSNSNPLSYAGNLYLGGELVSNLVIPASVSQVPAYAFYKCNMQSLNVGDGVTQIGKDAFFEAKMLKKAEFGNALEKIGPNAFRQTAIETLSFPTSLTALGAQSFCHCENLEKIYWGAGIKSVDTEAFYGCTSLKSVDVSDLSAWLDVTYVPNWRNGGYTCNPLYYADAFMVNGEEITDLVIPSDVADIPVAAFFGGANFRSITIPDQVKTIGAYAFSKCSALEEVHIGTGLKRLDMNVFSDCHKLARFHMEDGEPFISIVCNWSGNGIQDCYFGRDFNATGTLAPDAVSLRFGPQVKIADEMDYTKYTKLMLLESNAVTPPLINEFTAEQYGRIVVKVPEGAVEAYRNADVWKNFATITDSPEFALDNIKVEFNEETYSVYPGSNRPVLSYTITPEAFSTFPVEFVSTNESLLTFDSTGHPVSHGYGETPVSVRVKANGASADVVVKTFETPSSMTFACGGKLTLTVSEEYQMEPVIGPSPIEAEMITWTCWPQDGLSIDASGRVTALKELKDGYVQARTYNGVSAKCYIDVVAGTSGVDAVDAEPQALPADVFTPSGVLILKGAKAEDIARLASGIYVVRQGDKTSKLIK